MNKKYNEKNRKQAAYCEAHRELIAAASRFHYAAAGAFDVFDPLSVAMFACLPYAPEPDQLAIAIHEVLKANGMALDDVAAVAEVEAEAADERAQESAVAH